MLSDFVTSYFKTPWGVIVPRDYSIQFGMGTLSLMAVYFIIRLIWGGRKIHTMVCFTSVIAVMVLSFRILIFEPVEIIHFPQYAIVAFLLAAALEKNNEGYLISTILIMVTLMGIVDEINQYFYLTRQYTKYLDWNDFFLNEVGASLGLTFYYGFRIFEKDDVSVIKAVRNANVKLILFSILLPLFLYFIGIIKLAPAVEADSGFVFSKDGINIYLQRIAGFYESWKPGDRGWMVYTLSPLNGTLLMLAYGYLFTRFTSGFKKIFFFNLKSS
jgi:hypothetical protein